MLSVFDRKNPLAVVKAFLAAFQQDDDVRLVLKINNANQDPVNLAKLLDSAIDPRITIIRRVLSRGDMNALVNACDCIVSLHRSEGFGLIIAEAMWLGKPVVVTGYSGNMDFTHFDNSFLVGYTLVNVGPDNHPYPETCLWADPDIADAARQMRVVFENSDIRKTRAAKGASFIRNNFSPRKIGRLMLDRLEQVHAFPGK